MKPEELLSVLHTANRLRTPPATAGRLGTATRAWPTTAGGWR